MSLCSDPEVDEEVHEAEFGAKGCPRPLLFPATPTDASTRRRQPTAATH